MSETASLELDDPTLLRTRALVDGTWVDSDHGATLAVVNPATASTVAIVASVGASETRRAIEAAEAAMPAWSALPAKERASVLRRWFELMLAHQEDLARIMTAEQGKPLAESRGEVVYGASFIEWFAEEGKRIYGDVIPAPRAGQRILTLKQPIGVVAAITPWNFPNAMITRKVGPALAAGCGVVLKPASATPLSALALAELGMRAGLPNGILNVVMGGSGPIGDELTRNPTVRKLTFTGSTEVGKRLMEACAGTVKKTSMELGGNAPFIVFDDANLDEAVKGAMASKFRNAGQTCVCANRIFVQDAVYDEFSQRFTDAVRELRVGDGTADGVTIGPLIDERAAADVDGIVQDALGKGAKATLGGVASDLGRSFYQPTILVDVDASMRCFREEIFGPVAPLFRFDGEEEAIRLANDTEFGLASYFYARDIGRIWRVSEGLDYGIVGINEGIISTEVAPFGGVKESGIGREGSKYGIDDYVEIKYLCLGGIDRT
jgi:succinate-semialdehyde dehydrogenase/glutarate-semialdehyde dehydrogenase